jgi:hypothetical protein
MTIESIVEDAIRERRPLLLCYAGEARSQRIGHPHALYIGADGELRVEVFQIEGFAHTTLPAWQSFRIDEIVAAERLTDGVFGPAPGWDPFCERYAGGVVAMV